MPNALSVAGPASKYAAEGAPPAGFWAGLWHGVIAPITFVVSLFNANVRMYETKNKGTLYDLAFLIGAAASLSHVGRHWCGGHGCWW